MHTYVNSGRVQVGAIAIGPGGFTAMTSISPLAFETEYKEQHANEKPGE